MTSKPLYFLLMFSFLGFILMPVHFAFAGGGALEGGGGGGGTPPTMAYVTATPTSISSGQSSSISWSADLGSCVGTNFTTTGRTGAVTVNPTVTTTYTVTCSNAYGSDSLSATVTVSSAAPTATLTANPTSLSSGSATLTLTSTNATSCTGTNFTVTGTSGNFTVTPTQTTTYSVTCTGAGGTSPVASATVTYTAPQTIDLTAGSITPTTATVGTAVTLFSTISNTGGASSGAGFTNLFQSATDVSGTGASDIGTYTATALAGGANTAASFSYTFTSAATWYVRACADKSSSANTGVITESNESNNCGSWTAVVASAVSAPTATLTANPTSLSSGSATLTLTSTNATSCTGTNFTVTGTSGNFTVTPTQTTTYSVTCTGAGGTSPVASATVTKTGASTVSNAVCSGGTYLGTRTDTIDSCVSYCSGLTASCCSTYYTYGDNGDSYSCLAYSNTTATTPSYTTGGCDFVGGEPVNCNWTAKTATLISYGPAVTASLVTNPTSVSSGVHALITWSSTNATSCTGTNFSTGGATQGTADVAPTLTTTYSVSCTGAGGTVTDSKTITVNVFTVSCSAAPNPVTVSQPVSWTSSATGGNGTYTYSWTGTDSLSGTASSISKTYTTLGEKVATLAVTSGGSTITTSCTGSPCQTSSCTCTGPGCGIIVQEGISPDLTSSVPAIVTGSPYPGGTIYFGAGIENIGNNSISSVFQNRFQIDVNADGNGAYDINLDTEGTSGTQFTLQSGKICNTGTLVGSDTAVVYGSGDLDSTISSMCQMDSVSGQCCSATVQTYTGGGGGGGGGGGDGGGLNNNVNLVQNYSKKALAALYDSLALTEYDIAVSVYSSPTLSTCPTGSVCFGGIWTPKSGSLYTIPFGRSAAATSSAWSNIPAGTHKVRMCADSPTSQFAETNESNNCGPDYTFTVSGHDFTAGTPALNSGSLTSGQAVTFSGNISNAPSSYVVSAQCQATVVVATAGACSIAVNQDQIRWATTGATIVSAIDALTTSPAVPATGGGGTIVTHPGEGGFFTSQAIKADMLAHGGVSFPETTYINRTANADQVTLDRACVLITGNSAATAKTYGARSYSSCGNNSTLQFDGTNWSNPHNCYHLSGTLDCQYPGSPYGLSGTYIFPSPLPVGTHTYRLTDNASSNNTCQASITISPPLSGLCTLSATPSIISGPTSCTETVVTNQWYTGTAESLALSERATAGYTDCKAWAKSVGYKYWNETHTYYSGEADPYQTICTGVVSPTTGVVAKPVSGASVYRSGNVCVNSNSSLLTWVTNGGGTFSLDNGFGIVSTNSGQSCKMGGEELSSMGVCSSSFLKTYVTSECCSGVAWDHCPAPYEPEEFVCKGPAGNPENTVTVTPSVTTTYTGTVTTDPTIFNFVGTVLSNFQIDLQNNGSWDVVLSPFNSTTNLNVNQSKQVISPSWTAVQGTHAIRLCVNTPPTVTEGETSNNCGPSLVFTVGAPGQCADGIDNNSNGLIDLADTYACSNAQDATEETLASGSLSMSLVVSGGISGKNIVRVNTAASLTWSASNVVSGSCTLTGTNGDSFALPGTSGTQASSPLKNETTFTLSCTDINQKVVKATTTVKVSPYFIEI